MGQLLLILFQAAVQHLSSQQLTTHKVGVKGKVFIFPPPTLPVPFQAQPHLEVAGVDPGRGHGIHYPVQQALVLLQVRRLGLVQDDLCDLLAHLEPPAHVLVRHLLQQIVHGHRLHLLIHGCSQDTPRHLQLVVSPFTSQSSSADTCVSFFISRPLSLRGG